MIAERGTRGKLEKYFDLNRPLNVELQIIGAATYDFCCFGVDKNDKLSDDRYMIFYNQLCSPAGEITFSEIPSGVEFTIDLNALPEKIQKLVFTGSIDGAGTMKEISSHKIFIGDQISADFDGADFDREKAITSFEIYRKNGWRFNVVARGFNGGLDALLAFYGGEQNDIPVAPAPQPKSEPKEKPDTTFSPRPKPPKEKSDKTFSPHPQQPMDFLNFPPPPLPQKGYPEEKIQLESRSEWLLRLA